MAKLTVVKRSQVKAASAKFEKLMAKDPGAKLLAVLECALGGPYIAGLHWVYRAMPLRRILRFHERGWSVVTWSSASD